MALKCCECDAELIRDECPNHNCCEWRGLSGEYSKPTKYFCDDMRHLVCLPYSADNLHAMAADLGIKRCWWHSGASHAHYDIPKRRIAEITAKCELITPRELLAICKGERTE